MHFYSDQEDIVNTTENKQFYHTMGNQDIFHKFVPYHALLMNPALTVQLSHEDIKPHNLSLLEVLLNPALLSNL